MDLPGASVGEKFTVPLPAPTATFENQVVGPSTRSGSCRSARPARRIRPAARPASGSAATALGAADRAGGRSGSRTQPGATGPVTPLMIGLQMPSASNPNRTGPDIGSAAIACEELFCTPISESSEPS